jgi:hypothetical protein
MSCGLKFENQMITYLYFRMTTQSKFKRLALSDPESKHPETPETPNLRR